MTEAWVCPECGIDYGTLHPPFAINTIKSFPRRYTETLEPLGKEDHEAIIRTRPEPEVWSAIEYAAHVADTLVLFAHIVTEMYTRDSPSIPCWDPDEKAAADRYNEQGKADVLARLTKGATDLVAEAQKVDATGWSRTATFPWGERDLLTMLQNGVHEGVHHLQDIEKVLYQVRSI